VTTVNAKHQAALAAQDDEAAVLRGDITDTLAILVDLAAHLEALTDSRQRLRARVVTEETRAIFDKQTRLDRAAARGQVGRIEDTGLGWMNNPARIGTGQVQAPVQTMPALSVVAEIRFTIRHHIRRLGRPAKLIALEHEQTLAEDHNVCPWPRHAVLVTSLDVGDAGIAHLAQRLAVLVAGYTNRRDLRAIKRELDHLEEAALDITEGMPGKSALPIGSETCPHCGRNTLVLLSRVPGQHALVVKCEGTHRCECTWEFCDCHRNPRKNRHEWINSGSAAHTFNELHNLQTKRKELTILETKALDAIEQIRTIHQPTVTLEDGTTAPARFPLTGDAVPAHHVCNDDCRTDDEFDGPDGPVVHQVDLCGVCGAVPLTSGYDPDPSEVWPCTTYRATQLDDNTTDESR
jgi:hypothetical protein